MVTYFWSFWFLSYPYVWVHASISYTCLVSNLIPWALCRLGSAPFWPWLPSGGPQHSLKPLLSACPFKGLILVHLCRGPVLIRTLKQQTPGWLVQHLCTLLSQSLLHFRLDLLGQRVVELGRGILDRNPSGHERGRQYGCDNSCHPQRKGGLRKDKPVNVCTQHNVMTQSVLLMNDLTDLLSRVWTLTLCLGAWGRNVGFLPVSQPLLIPPHPLDLLFFTHLHFLEKI